MLLQLASKDRDLALFNMVIDSKLRGCDFVRLKVEDISSSGYTTDRAPVRQSKTGRPVKFEITEQTQNAVDAYLKQRENRPDDFLFDGRRGPNRHLSTRQYAGLVSQWVESIGLGPDAFGTHSLAMSEKNGLNKETQN